MTPRIANRAALPCRRGLKVFAAATDPIQAITAFMRGRTNPAVKPGEAAAVAKAVIGGKDDAKDEKKPGAVQQAAAKPQPGSGKPPPAAADKAEIKPKADGKAVGDGKPKPEAKPKPEGIAGQPPPPKREEAVDHESMDR